MKIYFKILIVLLVLISSSNNLFAKTKKHKKMTKRHAHTTRVSRVSRFTKRGKKHGRKVHHGTGPDLKEITKDSPYTEDPKNGVNSVETKSP